MGQTILEKAIALNAQANEFLQIEMSHSVKAQEAAIECQYFSLQLSRLIETMTQEERDKYYNERFK